MEKGKNYEVYYKDDSQSRHKTLEFRKFEFNMLHFYNHYTDNIEIIPQLKIIRIEGAKENGKSHKVN